MLGTEDVLNFLRQSQEAKTNKKQRPRVHDGPSPWEIYNKSHGYAWYINMKK